MAETAPEAARTAAHLARNAVDCLPSGFQSSHVPVHKDHITDWITSETSKALTFKADEFKPAAIQVTGDVASACYWITFRWQDKDGKGAAHTVRITHAWLRTGKDWHIISGMSMPEPESPPK